ncbi:MAG: PD-(D/E)XK nuclease family protein [Cyanobacteria bacterium P01_A01_bin.123]
MPLFNQLLRLYASPKPTEDFFTEIFAYLLQEESEILTSWLKRIRVIPSNLSSFQAHVFTQGTYEPLESHDLASRPDIQIEVLADQQRTIIFLESKITAVEGDKQLRRYAEILESLSHFDVRFLIYITRDYVSKADLSIKDIDLKRVIFVQLRWQDFYRFLEQQKNTQLVREVKLFMEQQRMNVGNQFLATDLIALMHFHRSIKLMEACLREGVEEKFNEAFGKMSNLAAASTQFQNHGRFIRYVSLNKRSFWPGIGFFGMTSNAQLEYPNLGVFLQIDPGCQFRDSILKGMIDIANDKSNAWKGFGLNNASSWPNISYTKNLQEFLSEDDQVFSIQRFFLECIGECQKLKDSYSDDLHWS